jgi:hypothetical protein
MIGLSPGLVGGTDPSLLEFQFYGLAAEITLQFYEWTCHTELVDAPVGAGAAGPDGGRWFSRAGPDKVRGGAYMADPPDDFSPSRLG